MMKPSNETITKKVLPYFILCLLLWHDKDKVYITLCERRSQDAKTRRKKKRVTWEYICERMGDYQFRRMFRMSKDCFSSLSNTIKLKIGESKFKSQEFIDAFLIGKNSMYDANSLTTAGYVSGEIKLAITIRLLAGGDSYDLAVIFDIYPTHIHKIFEEVIREWIIKPNIGNINILEYLNDEEAMDEVSDGFSRRSSGILRGAIGAIDGWLVKIRRPNSYHDGMTNAVPFFSGKDFML